MSCESIVILAEVEDYKANPKHSAMGTVIEAKLDKGRGPVATLLVQKGTLKFGDCVVVGTSYGRIRKWLTTMVVRSSQLVRLLRLKLLV